MRRPISARYSKIAQRDDAGGAGYDAAERAERR